MLQIRSRAEYNLMTGCQEEVRLTYYDPTRQPPRRLER